MSAIRDFQVLDRLLDPVTRCLTPEVARRLVELRADPEFQQRMDRLAERCTEGQLTPEERGEYDIYVRSLHIIGILQSKARRLLTAQDPEWGADLWDHSCWPCHGRRAGDELGRTTGTVRRTAFVSGAVVVAAYKL
jgi:hypothetical protein